MANTYTIGTSINFTATFKDATGALADPDVVICRVRTPTKTISVEATTSSSTGVWTASYSLDNAEHGTYYYRFEGTGAVQAAAEASFKVAVSKVL